MLAKNKPVVLPISEIHVLATLRGGEMEQRISKSCFLFGPVTAVHVTNDGSRKNPRLDHRKIGRQLAQRKVIAGDEIEFFYPVPLARSEDRCEGGRTMGDQTLFRQLEGGNGPDEGFFKGCKAIVSFGPGCCRRFVCLSVAAVLLLLQQK